MLDKTKRMCYTAFCCVILTQKKINMITISLRPPKYITAPYADQHFRNRYRMRLKGDNENYKT